MKSVADSAALASSKELQLAQMDASKVTVIANNVINGLIQDVTSNINVDFSAMTVQVTIQKNLQPRSLVSGSATNLQVSADRKNERRDAVVHAWAKSLRLRTRLIWINRR